MFRLNAVGLGELLQAFPEGSRAVGTFAKKRDLFLTHQRGEDQGAQQECNLVNPVNLVIL